MNEDLLPLMKAAKYLGIGLAFNDPQTSQIL
jgi:hypothetical protein